MVGANTRSGAFETEVGKHVLDCALSQNWDSFSEIHAKEFSKCFPNTHCRKSIIDAARLPEATHKRDIELIVMDNIRHLMYCTKVTRCSRLTRSSSQNIAKAKSTISETTTAGSTFSKISRLPLH